MIITGRRLGDDSETGYLCAVMPGICGEGR